MFVLREIAGLLAALLAAIKYRNEIEKRLMSKLNDLQTSVESLTVAVDSAVALIKPPSGATDTDLAAVQASVDAQTSKLTAAVVAATTPAPPAP